MTRQQQRPPWSWSGFVATLIALSIGGGFAVAMIGATLQHEQISQQGAALLNTLGGGLIAVLSLWIGGQVEAARSDKEPHKMTTETPEPRDPATNPDRDIETQPQDPEAVPTQPEHVQPDARER